MIEADRNEKEREHLKKFQGVYTTWASSIVLQPRGPRQPALSRYAHPIINYPLTLKIRLMLQLRRTRTEQKTERTISA